MSDAPQSMDHEEAFLEAFITKERRSRLRFELRKRGGFMDRFCHDALSVLDPRFVSRLPLPISDAEQVLQALRQHGAVGTCYAMSMCERIHRRLLPLQEALDAAVGHGLPSIISCLPGRLVYVETEQERGPPDRFLLRR